MKVQTTIFAVGARYYDIADDKTGEIKRFTSVFVLTPTQSGFNDRAGYEPGKVRCSNSEVVKKLMTIKLPAEIHAECEITVNAKGESRLIIHDIGDVVKPALHKAA